MVDFWKFVSRAAAIAELKAVIVGTYPDGMQTAVRIVFANPRAVRPRCSGQ